MTTRSLISAGTNAAGDMRTLSAEALAVTGRARIKPNAKTLDICSFIGAAALAAFYLATSIHIASHRLLYFDELYTVHIARQRDWVTIWSALRHAADSLPPVYYMVVRLFDNLFGRNDVSVRLPSGLAFIAGLLITFDCARRFTDGLHGLIALSVLTCSFLPYYGYEARSYAIYFMLAALSLWIWTCTPTDSKLWAILFGAVLCLGVTFHYYAVLLLVPYGLWEIYRWRPWRRPSPKLIAGLVGTALTAALLSPLIMSFSRQFSRGFWAYASFYALKMTFSELFPDGLFLLALIMIWVALSRPDDTGIVVGPVQPAESLGWFFLCIPLAGFVVAELKTNAFVSRYFIGALPGIAVAFSCCIWRNFCNAYRVTLGVFLLLMAAGVATQVTVLRHPELWQQPRTKQYLSQEDSVWKDGKRFMLFGKLSVFLESEYYSKHPQECVLLLPTHEGSVGPSSLKPALILTQYYPLHFWKLDDLKKHARETALIEPSLYVLGAMTQAGFKVESRFSKPLEVVYLK